jgi:sugar/nucleoside kinase (ribokinase family)
MAGELTFKDKKLVVGVGSALMDILLPEEEFIDRVLSLTTAKSHIVPGGSACNTVTGIGKLGGQARFVGKCGRGNTGALFEAGLKKDNVEPLLFKSSAPTGRVLSIITPDAQRSMFTFLGASSETRPEEITAECFENAAIVHIEGYIIFNEDLILTVLNAAKAAGARVSLDLASFTVVEESKALLEQIVKDYVDILVANEDEAHAFSGYADELKAINALSRNASIAALKIGERGSLVAYDGDILTIKAQGSGAAVDTTGAGDLWAAGFLFGLVNGYGIEKCGELASACGYEVCQVVGTKIAEEGWHRIKILLEE